MSGFKDWNKAVGPCPVCGRTRGFWFNDVPLTAHCWGKGGKKHREACRILSDPHQPYGKVGRKTRWVTTDKRGRVIFCTKRVAELLKGDTEVPS